MVLAVVFTIAIQCLNIGFLGELVLADVHIIKAEVVGDFAFHFGGVFGMFFE